MKRVSDLYEKMITIDNLLLADKKAGRGKSFKHDVIKHRLNSENNILKLHQTLKNKTFKNSPYKTFVIKDPKEREICSLPYYPDRIVHHAVMNVLEPILTKTFTANTYNCIKGRGIHKASYDLRKALKGGDKYCLKLDIKKFYPNIDVDILLSLLNKKLKDKDLLNLLCILLGDKKGLQLGSYLSQHLANFYLTYFDHWLKETLKVRHYFRYCDDIVILGDDKQVLREIFQNIESYLNTNLKLEVKSNWQIFPIKDRGIDWVGYKHYHTHVLIRKRIKQKYKKSKNKFNYNGWLVHANCFNLRKKYESNN
jgi:RNA-directed DNA polymerase